MGTDFNNDKKYNSERYVSMTLNINKVCYSQGEYIQGTIFLQGKPDLIQKELIDPTATATLSELHQYTYQINNNDGDSHDHSEHQEKEEITIFTLNLNFSNYRGANLMQGVNIPFSVQITNCYPSCIFNYRDYVRHFFTIEFPSIQAKRTKILIIKNSQNYTIGNGLYKSPAIEIREKEKRKCLCAKGKFAAVLQLQKNVFFYDEEIPFELSIDCSQLSIDIKSVEISLLRIESENMKKNYKSARNTFSKTITSNKINLLKGLPKYIIKDIIQFPLLADFNPLQIYKSIEMEPVIPDTLKKLHLAPSCSGGLLSVQYYFCIRINIDSIFSSDEKIRIPIDFYVPYNTEVNQSYNTGLSQSYNGGNFNNININNNNLTNNNFPNNLNVQNNIYQNNNLYGNQRIINNSYGDKQNIYAQQNYNFYK